MPCSARVRVSPQISHLKSIANWTEAADLEQISIAIGTSRESIHRSLAEHSKLGNDFDCIEWEIVAGSGSQLSARINFWIVAVSEPSSRTHNAQGINNAYRRLNSIILSVLQT